MNSTTEPENNSDSLAAFYKDLLNHIGDGVYFVDCERKIQFWNKGAEAHTGYAESDVLGHRCSDDLLCHISIDGKNLCANECPLAACMEDGGQRVAEAFLHNRDGRRLPVKVRVQPMRNQDGKIVGAVEIFSDSTAEFEMRRHAESLQRMAFLDHLTQLSNRRYLESALRALLDVNAEEQTKFGVLLIDLDDFKPINDTYGHNCGDLVLRQVGRILSNALRPTDDVGRWGGDEFLVIAYGVDDKILPLLAQRCVDEVKKTRAKDCGAFIPLSISVGATLARSVDDLQTLIARADALLYRSKVDGRNRATMD